MVTTMRSAATTIQISAGGWVTVVACRAWAASRIADRALWRSCVVGDDPSAGRDVGVMGEAALDRVRRCLDPAKNPGQRIIPDPRVFETVHGTHAGSPREADLSTGQQLPGLSCNKRHDGTGNFFKRTGSFLNANSEATSAIRSNDNSLPDVLAATGTATLATLLQAPVLSWQRAG